MKIINASMNYFEKVLELSYKTYKKECNYVIGIEGAKREEIAKYLIEMFENQTVLLCMNNNELVGYLGYNDKWETKDNLFCKFPLWGYGAVEKDRTKIISMLFQNMAKQLCTEQKTHFEIKIYAHDVEIIQLFSFLQFGIQCEDGIYNYQMKDICLDNVIIRELTATEKTEQWHNIWGLLEQLIEHLQKSPVFYQGTEFTEQTYKFFILDENTRVVISEKDEKMIGIITANIDGNSFINEQINSCNVGDIYLDPKYRGSMVAHNMLNYLINVLTANGMQKCFVEHGTANPNARGFWNKYFTSYSYTMIRDIELVS